MALPASEAKRKLVHVGVGAFALFLRWLTWPQAAACAMGAFLFNWQVLPRLGGRALWREEEHRAGRPQGILIYPLAVLALVLIFHAHLSWAAALWGILAVGDGMATFVGLLAGGPRLGWNPRKSWAGLVAFWVCGSAAAAFLWAWTDGVPLSVDHLGRAALVALACAVVESLPSTLDDNVSVPAVGAMVLPVVAVLDPALLLDPALHHRAGIGLLVNLPVAALALRARSIDGPGAASAVLIGVMITAGLGLPGYALMAAFFVLGSTATKWGYAIKLARGIAQEKGGARGWRNAWANGGVPAGLGLAAGIAPGYAPLVTLAYAAAVATAAADTCSSEVGKAYGRRTFLITTLRPVPPGTEGAVSLEGTVGGLLGGLAVGSVGALTGLYGWPAAILAGASGLLGSLAESVIGAVAEKRGWMDNDVLNALNTAIGAWCAVGLLHAMGGLP